MKQQQQKKKKKMSDESFEIECKETLSQLITLEHIWRFTEEGDLSFEMMLGEDEDEEKEKKSDEEEKEPWSAKLFSFISSGIVLCNLANAIKPGTVQKINNTPSRDFLCKENGRQQQHKKQTTKTKNEK